VGEFTQPRIVERPPSPGTHPGWGGGPVAHSQRVAIEPPAGGLGLRGPETSPDELWDEPPEIYQRLTPGLRLSEAVLIGSVAGFVVLIGAFVSKLLV